MAVAAMLIVLGMMNLGRGIHHHHLHPSLRGRLRPLAIGVVHGLAGSAAVALLVLATIHNRIWALAYLGLFGAGTMLGMMLLTTAMMMPLAAAARRFGSFERLMAKLTGTISLAYGHGHRVRAHVSIDAVLASEDSRN